ncbi:MAG TPA: MFS transporter [Burkholderiales bacterium]|nr:MFS transporter [Burkholderiales bacterium]
MLDWFRELSAQERKTLFAALGGWSVDAFDVMVYTFVIPTLLTAWSMSKGQAGWIATAALITSAIGGWVAGILADRLGRVQVLQITILWFALFTFLSGFTRSFEQLFVTRALQGLGFGGEWAVGSVLIGEMIRAQHRGKAVGTVQSGWAIGWGGAAVVFAIAFSVLPEHLAWRTMFWIGVLPALLVVYIRRNLSEPEIFLATRARADQSGSHFLEIFSPELLRTTVVASLLSSGMMAAYYAVTTWLPTYLKTVRHLSVLGTGWYTLVIIIGSFVGFLVAAYLHDLMGRRKTFILFAACTAVVAVFYTLLPISDDVMLFLGFPLGFFLHGNFSGFGPLLTELFPSRVRGSGQGFAYNFGRGIGAFSPPLVGSLSERIPLSDAIGIVTGTVLVVAVAAIALLPETRGKPLAVYD